MCRRTSSVKAVSELCRANSRTKSMSFASGIYSIISANAKSGQTILDYLGDGVAASRQSAETKWEISDGGFFPKAAAPCEKFYFASGTVTTPHGPPGDFTRAISFSVARSTTEMSSDGPLATKRYFPSGERSKPQGRVPTLIVFKRS